VKCTVLNYKEIMMEKEELQATDSIRAKFQDNSLSDATACTVLYSTDKRTLHDVQNTYDKTRITIV
jgi:hypothetical protein